MPAPTILSATASAVGAALLLVATAQPRPDATRRVLLPAAAAAPAGGDAPEEPRDVPAAASTPPSTAAPTLASSPAGVAARELSAGERVAWFALSRVGVPYVYGAAGPDAYDCSGLTRAALASVGVDVPHRSAWQAGLGRPVDLADVRAGDLLFAAGGRPRHDLGHVGIAVSAREWVHAPAPGQHVRREPIPFPRLQRARRLTGP